MVTKREVHLIRDEAGNFIVDRRARQLSGRTIEFYQYYLDITKHYCEELKLVSMDEFTPTVLRSILEQFGRGHNRGGVHALYRTIRTFCNWYAREFDGSSWGNPILKVEAPKVKQDPIPGVPVADVMRMVATCQRDWYGRRDRAVLLFLLDTGLRRNEFLDLNLSHVSLRTGTVHVHNGKGDKDRVVFFGDRTARELVRYLRGRSEDPGTAPFWLSRYGDRLEPAGLRSMLDRRSRLAGLAQLPSPHDFRRTFALEMLRNGANLLVVSRLLGHESLEVTKRYLDLLTVDLEGAHRLAGPVDHVSQRLGLHEAFRRGSPVDHAHMH